MRNFLVIGLMLIGLSACKKYTGIPNNFDYGELKGNTYTNAFFGFTWNMPEGWKAMPNSMMDSLREQTVEELQAKDLEEAEAVKNADVRTANLLAATCDKGESSLFFTTNINFIAENVRIAMHIRNGKDYLEEALKHLDGSLYSTHQQGGIYPVSIGGKDFHAMDMISEYQELTFRQTYYATVIDGFAFTFIASYVDDEQKEAVENAIAAMRFN